MQKSSDGNRHSSRYRLVVGIDYGTTFSGISFVTTDKSSIDDVQVISSWPSNSTQSSWKVPTRMAYAKENQHKRTPRDTWGFGVGPDLVSCAWTKLLLDSKSERMAHDDPYLQTAIDSGILHVPDGAFRRSPREVCQDFLTNLYNHMVEQVAAQMGRDFLAATPMRCWLTVPASWSERAKMDTKAAARLAGFGSRSGDTIDIITEPEAAAIATFKEKFKPGAPNPPSRGENVIICDCGGGTVDITTYNIAQTSPSLMFDEVVVGQGAKCGSTFIDRNLHLLMVERFGEAYEQVPLHRRGLFLAAWDRVKRSFRYDSLSLAPVEELGPIQMSGVDKADWYDSGEGSVMLTSEDIESLFAPVVQSIIGLISEQVEQVACKGQRVNRLILVGGFAESHYLQESIKEWCKSPYDISVLVGQNPQAAILRGAAVRGLEGTTPRSRRCRRHYGVGLALPFREGLDPEECQVIWPWDRSKMCKDRVHWLIDKGTELGADEKRSTQYSRVFPEGTELRETCNLYSCPADAAPDWTFAEGVDRIGRVKVVLDRHKLEKMDSRHKYKWVGSREWKVDFDVDFNFGSKSGQIETSVLVDGTVVGTAKIKFD
ncbi:hypothetical protein DOTSEDRAFT_88524 [Dothistroma septosporum NZE10]|uniref:Actin-like ATPase domain-containing protein n=1 Tax=Dothistroma septosporum (strain NZE10 / CBS 128990) TaxID=675120 RepID=N1PPH7_DOTSN|nr:hypothetical protein DOTSEDRAFT_88524 [Dothistroma septosporum NZE10]